MGVILTVLVLALVVATGAFFWRDVEQWLREGRQEAVNPDGLSIPRIDGGQPVKGTVLSEEGQHGSS